MIKKILPVLDDFKHMLEKSGENAGEDSVLDGARMIYDKLNKILEAEGLSVIDALGQEFDPQIHEAMMIQKTAEKQNHNKIIGVFQEGYKIKDRLLRPTKVVVGNYDGEEK
ncbi:MAG: nucleotide exchange factor GrpE [Calditrichia bacterium]